MSAIPESFLENLFTPSRFNQIIRNFLSSFDGSGEELLSYFEETERNLQEVLICVFDRIRREPAEEARIMEVIFPKLSESENRIFLEFFFKGSNRRPPDYLVMERFLLSLKPESFGLLVDDEMRHRIFAYLINQRTPEQRKSLAEALFGALSYQGHLDFARFIVAESGTEKVTQAIALMLIETLTSHGEYKKDDIDLFPFLEVLLRHKSYSVLLDTIHSLLISLRKNDELAHLSAEEIVSMMAVIKERSKVALTKERVARLLSMIALAKASGNLPQEKQARILLKKFHITSFILANHGSDLIDKEKAIDLCVDIRYSQLFVITSAFLSTKGQFSRIFDTIPKQNLVPKVSPWYMVFLGYEPCLEALRKLPRNEMSILLGELGVQHQDFWKYRGG